MMESDEPGDLTRRAASLGVSFQKLAFTVLDGIVVRRWPAHLRHRRELCHKTFTAAFAVRGRTNARRR